MNNSLYIRGQETNKISLKKLKISLVRKRSAVQIRSLALLIIKELRKISDSFFSFQVTSGYLLHCISLISFFRFLFRQAILRKTLFFNSSEYYTFVTQNEYYA